MIKCMPKTNYVNNLLSLVIKISLFQFQSSVETSGNFPPHPLLKSSMVVNGIILGTIVNSFIFPVQT